ncbi:MAG TPA: HAD family hydrolase [Candidatus Fournierella merdavium]|nr:HAD family hydrolase [Candidatus Fournierella merdavium]
MRFDHVVFDLDGTLLNTLRDLADAANFVCRANGWPEHTVDEYRYFVGNGIPKLCWRFAPETARDEAAQKEVLAQFSARYDAHKEDTTAPYPGIEAMLDKLEAAGVRYGVLTNKEDSLAKAVMEHYFPGRFRFVQGAVPGVPTKPDPTALRRLLARMGADPARTLFVGDSDVDIHTAHNAGLPGAGVLWGFRTRQELKAAGANALADTPADLARIVLEGAVHNSPQAAR